VLKRTTGVGEPEARKVLSSDDFAWMSRLVRDVPVAAHVMAYVAKLVVSTHPTAAAAPEAVRKFVRYGASPRAAQALVLGGKVKALLGGRLNVGFEDVRSVLLPVLRHRIILNFEAEAEGVAPEHVLDSCLKGVGEPAK
jgi:MoxR-like ATPase